MNKTTLIKFERQVADFYEQGLIKAPVHLRDGNEDQLIEIFKDIVSGDWVFSTWASHLHALLHGVPDDLVMKDILEGRSISLIFPEYKFYSSGIVGGICPIALGVAWASKKKGNGRVNAFIGDMCATTGIYNECMRYSMFHNLPITWIIEDNGKSVGTPTKEAWNHIELERDISGHAKNADYLRKEYDCDLVDFKYYKFESSWPHSGTGEFVSF